ncbi:MFS transporter [Actinoallomurus purpureus]|uniref:MFS transporter n=1 Tax=Actinoallomurus purpureus TaxID=478114 RepID=UPI002092FC65|nr:MFS transporter [Actinoallomurus purpureus]MCO6010765.1 MFS transporter [Actinoallomurus purpureus]
MKTSEPLRANNEFRNLWVAQALSKLGSQASYLALPLLVLSLTHSPAQAGLVGFVKGAAEVAFLLPGGTFSDRHDRRRTMLTCDVVRAVGMAALAYSVAVHHAVLPLILGVAALDGACTSTFAGAVSGAVRRIVPEEQFSSAVALIQARNAAVYTAGPALGGLLFELSPVVPFVADAGSYLFSMAAVLAIRTSMTARRSHGDKENGFWKDTAEGLGFVMRSAYLRNVVLNATASNFTYGGIVLVAVAASYEGGSSGLSVGTIVTLSGLGSLVGSLFAPRAIGRLGTRQIVLAVGWVDAVLTLLMATTSRPLVLGALLAVSGLLIPALNVVFGSTLLRMTPDHLQGRVQNTVGFTAMSLAPVGPMLAGALLGGLGAAVAFVVFGLFLCAIAGVNTAKRHLFDAPATDSSAGPPTAATVGQPTAAEPPPAPAR